MHIVLVGLPNSGKTTVFNGLTGAGATIGNWSGVTVAAEQETFFRKKKQITLTDLPGIYSLAAPFGEETEVLSWLRRDPPDAIINVVNCCNLRRHLPLTLHLLELGIPTVIALNFSDEAEKQGIPVDAGMLSAALGVPAVLCSGYDEGSLLALLDAAISAKAVPCRTPADAGERYAMASALADDASALRIPSLDRFLCRGRLAIPLFLLIMLAVFFFSFGPLGAFFSRIVGAILSHGTEAAEAFLLHFAVAVSLSKLIVEGIIGGVGSILVFLPQLLLMFFSLSILETSGYMARTVFITDRFMHRLGLSGLSVIPMVLGFGCSVPGIMACRTLANRQEKLLTVFTVPFMSCSARMPVYAFFASALFEESAWLIVGFCYLFGILMGLIAAAVIGKILPKEQGNFFSLELPPYRKPHWPSVFRSLRDRMWEYLEKAGTVILLSSVTVWLFSHLTLSLDYTEQLSMSLMGLAGQGIAPLFAPLGLGDPSLAAALITGLLSKESIVATLSVLSFDPGVLNPLAALSFLIFVLLYPPCAASLSVIRSECGYRFLAAVICGYLLIAWGMSFLFFRLGTFLL